MTHSNCLDFAGLNYWPASIAYGGQAVGASLALKRVWRTTGGKSALSAPQLGTPRSEGREPEGVDPAANL